jgi:hypothetical protein
VSADAANVMRQAFAGMLWTKHWQGARLQPQRGEDVSGATGLQTP